jgi:cytochrome c6
MSRSPRQLLLSCLSLLLIWGLLISPASAAAISEQPLTPAAQLFETHCIGCHVGGGNIVRRRKTLKQRALQRNGVDSVDAIAALITHGKGLMSAYRDRLSPAEINLLAEYVWQRSQNHWR